MSRRSKLILFAVGGLVAGLGLAAVILLLVLGAHGKRQVQDLASRALGMEVSVVGAVRIGLLPSLHVAMENVQIRNRGSEIASAAQASLGIELLPLLRNEVRMHSAQLKHVRLSIERQRDGKFNFEAAPEPNAESSPADLPTDVAAVSLSDATLVYLDQQTGKRFEAGACEVDLRQLQLSGKAGATRLKRLSFTGALACAQISAPGLVLTEVKSPMLGKDGVFSFEPVTLRVFGGQGSGAIRTDFSGAVPGYRINGSLSKFQLAQLSKTLSPTHVGDGSMDFFATLSMHGRAGHGLLRSAAGQASLRGHDLTLAIGDIDAAFSRYESSQSFNLVDVGALFFAGPLGLVVTKGYGFASNFSNPGGSSRISTLVSDWSIERGVAQAKDVAMATKDNRVALKGDLDFVNGRFNEVTVALIDEQGCSRVQQQIRGSFDKPEVDKPNVLTSLAGPVRNLLKQAEKLIGGHCDVFYAGSVAAPR